MDLLAIIMIKWYSSFVYVQSQDVMCKIWVCDWEGIQNMSA